MRKERRNRLLAGLVVVAIVGGLAWLVVSSHEPPEPVYQGKRLSEWLDLVVQDSGREQAVREIGTNGIPTLLRMLRARDSKLKLKLIELAQKQRLIKINFVSADIRHLEAVFGFQILGSAASNAVPALIQIYEENISEASQLATIDSIGSIGPAAAAAVPVLLRTAANTNAPTRGFAVIALRDIHANPELAVPVLVKSLKDPGPLVRALAAEALGFFGKDAKAAVPVLVDLLKDPYPDVRHQAGETLKAIDPEAAAKAGVK